MGDPITVEKCEICQQDFSVPMQKYRRGGGYQTGDATFSVTYGNDSVDDLDLAMACPNCVSSIANVARVEIDRLKPKALAK